MTIEGIAHRYGVLPTVVARDDADYLIRHITILKEAGVVEDESSG
jgi:hypothetical protein